MKKTDTPITGEGLSVEAIRRMEKERDSLKSQLPGMAAGLDRMDVESAISALETRIKMARASSPVTNDPELDEKIKSLEKQRDDLRRMLADGGGGSDLSSLPQKISGLNVQIEMLRAFSMPSTMGPPPGTADKIQSLEKERDDLKKKLNNLRPGLDRDNIESAISEIEIKIAMLKALSNPAPSSLQGVGILKAL